jgi:hypothetical protein
MVPFERNLLLNVSNRHAVSSGGCADTALGPWKGQEAESLGVVVLLRVPTHERRAALSISFSAYLGPSQPSIVTFFCHFRHRDEEGFKLIFHALRKVSTSV